MSRTFPTKTRPPKEPEQHMDIMSFVQSPFFNPEEAAPVHEKAPAPSKRESGLSTPASSASKVSRPWSGLFSNRSEDVEQFAVTYDGEGSDENPYLVKFLDGDSSNPFNFTTVKKWLILITVGSATFTVAFGSSVFVGGLFGMERTFGTSEIITLLGLSFYVGGFSFGPMVWAPLSEHWGRRPVYLLTFTPFVLFQIGAALAPNITTLIICRLLAGTIGSSVLTNSAGVIGDTFTAAERGPPMALYALMPFLGPVMGPLAGGFIGEQSKESWRWLFALVGIYGAFCLLAGFFVPETHGPTLLRKRAAHLSKTTGKAYVSAQEFQPAGSTTAGGPPKFKTVIARPFVLLFTEPIVFLFAVYAAFIYGVLYLLFGAYPIIFEQERGWTPGMAGIPFLAVGLGMILGLAGAVIDSGKYAAKSKAAGHQLPPEERLRICCVGGILLPISLAWYAASSKGSVHWIVPTLAGVPFGASMLLVFLGGTSYLVDVYLQYAASAMAANSFLRSLFASGFPLFTHPMFDAIGSSWSLAILAFVCLALTPIPFLFVKKGASIRSKSRYATSSRTPMEPGMGFLVGEGLVRWDGFWTPRTPAVKSSKSSRRASMASNVPLATVERPASVYSIPSSLHSNASSISLPSIHATDEANTHESPKL